MANRARMRFLFFYGSLVFFVNETAPSSLWFGNFVKDFCSTLTLFFDLGSFVLRNAAEKIANKLPSSHSYECEELLGALESQNHELVDKIVNDRSDRTLPLILILNS